MEKNVLTEFKGPSEPEKIVIGAVIVAVVYTDGKIVRFKRKW